MRTLNKNGLLTGGQVDVSRTTALSGESLNYSFIALLIVCQSRLSNKVTFVCKMAERLMCRYDTPLTCLSS